ncbi:hypothetical protein OIU76_010582 [Salix suchowensis]|nr:hypothetical protein OIU76_010582 [Salix suchowensis]
MMRNPGLFVFYSVFKFFKRLFWWWWRSRWWCLVVVLVQVDIENWSFLSWYLNLLAKYPVLTKAVTSAILTLMGDLICQMCLEVFVNDIDCHSFDYIEWVAFALYSDQWMHHELKLLVEILINKL